jgi:hypothetical protein
MFYDQNREPHSAFSDQGWARTHLGCEAPASGLLGAKCDEAGCFAGIKQALSCSTGVAAMRGEGSPPYGYGTPK